MQHLVEVISINYNSNLDKDKKICLNNIEIVFPRNLPRNNKNK